jgi:condensin complex subunit 2
LAASFASLQLKKFELEFSVDPLFKKASADFDEGGAKGLLLNHLAIDSQGRIVFDSSDDAGDASGEGNATRRKGDAIEEDEAEDEQDDLLEEASKAEEDDEDVDIDIGALGAKFFPDLDRLEEQDICPSLKNFDLGDPLGSMDIPFLKAPEDWRQEREEKAAGSEAVGDKSGIFLDDDNPAGFDDDDDGLLGNFDMPADIGFGEGGEVWARDAAIEPQMRAHDAGYDNDGMGGVDGEDGETGTFDPASGQFVVSLNPTQGGHEDILSYFDQALQKNWAGPEHWRIRKIKDSSKPIEAKTRKEKIPFEIDFLSSLEHTLAETIYTPASSNSAISMPKKDWKSKTRNLLPDDKHFNSKQLLRLFLKPQARMGSRRPGFGVKSGGFGQASQKEDDVPEGDMDEAFWARKEDPIAAGNDEVLPQGDYDANFFQDDGLAFPGGLDDDDDMEFADARDHFSPGPGDRGAEGGMDGIANALAGGVMGSQGTDGEGAFGTQLVTQSRRLRPEYVQYARVATKVDVRRLKEEMWKGMGIEGADSVRSLIFATHIYLF